MSSPASAVAGAAAAPPLATSVASDGSLESKEEAAIESAIQQAEGEKVTLQAKVSAWLNTTTQSLSHCHLCSHVLIPTFSTPPPPLPPLVMAHQWKTNSYTLLLPLDCTVGFMKMQIAIQTNVKVASPTPPHPSYPPSSAV